MKRPFFVGLCACFVFMLMMPAAWASSPKEVVEKEVRKVLSTLADEQFKQQPRDVKIAKINEIIGEIFDYRELSRRTLGREWKKMNADQQKEFVDLFTKLLESVYADRLLAYSNEKVVFEKETMLKKGKAEVQSFITTGDGKKIPLFYRLTNKSGQWKVYDVIIEGVSMVRNYRSQFRQILAKDSPEKLLEILRNKVKKG